MAIDCRTQKANADAFSQKAESLNAAAMRAAIEEVRPHARAWIDLLSAYVDSLPPDTMPTPENSDGCSDKGYAEHELRAMKRDLAALLAV